MTLEAGPFRDRDLHHLVLDADTRRHFAAKPPLALFAGLGRLCRIVHAARLDRGAALQTFQAGDLLALLANDLFQGDNPAGQLNQQSFKLWTAQVGKVGWRRHMMQRVDRAESTQGKNEGLPTLLPLLR